MGWRNKLWARVERNLCLREGPSGNYFSRIQKGLPELAIPQAWYNW